MTAYTGTAVGKGNVVSTLLGFINTDTSIVKTASASTIVKNATVKAVNTWNSYLRNTKTADNGIKIPSYFTPVPDRVNDAAYFYALEFIAEEYARIRIGNIGANPNSKVAQNLLNRVRALTQIAREGITRYEQWCSAEAAIYGADYLEFMGTIGSVASDAANEASTYWTSCRADLATLDGVTDAVHKGVADKIAYGTYGYSLKNTATKMMSKKPGFSGARNPAIGQYWQSAAKGLYDASKGIIASYEKWVTDTKLQYAVSGLGI